MMMDYVAELQVNFGDLPRNAAKLADAMAFGMVLYVYYMALAKQGKGDIIEKWIVKNFDDGQITPPQAAVVGIAFRKAEEIIKEFAMMAGDAENEMKGDDDG